MKSRLARYIVASFTVALLLLHIVGCSPKESESVSQPPAVTVAHPIEQNVTDYLDFTGNTAAFNSVQLVARVEGYLEQIHFVDGTNVRTNDVLFTIQQDQYQAQLQQAEAQVLSETAALVHARTELARYTGLAKQKAAPQTEVDRWQYQKDSSSAQLLAARAQVELAKLNLSYTVVKAPFDGRLGRHLVDIGNVVGAMGEKTVLAEIDQINPLYVYFTVNERDLLRVIARTKGEFPRQSLSSRRIVVFFGLANDVGYPHQGYLDFASISVVPTTGTLQVRATFPNPSLTILPGLFVRVRVPSQTSRPAFVVPGESVSFDQQGEYVMVVNDKNIVERRGIKTGIQLGDNIVIEEGLKANDSVIIEGLMQAIPGREVTPQLETIRPGPANAAIEG